MELNSSHKKEKIFFPNLDALRTIAFLFVFSEHVLWGAIKKLGVTDPFYDHILYSIFANGEIGVSIFFVLSGFLITYLILKEIELTGKLDVKSFYFRRALRIWPLYYAVLIFVFHGWPFILQLFGKHLDNPANPLYYFTFLSNFDMIRLDRLSHMQSGVTWSVAIEEQFYLVWPLMFLLVPRRFFISVFLFFIAVSLTFRFFNYDQHQVIYFHTLGVCADLAVGGLSAYLILNNVKFRCFFTNINRGIRNTIYFSGILYVLLHEYFLTIPYAPAYSRLISTLFFAFIILDQNFNEATSLKLGKLKLFSSWGKYTYGLYMLHPIAVLMVKLFTDYFDVFYGTFFKKLGVGLITLLVTAVISYISYHIFEKHFLRLKDRFAFQRNGVHKTATSTESNNWEPVSADERVIR